MDSLSSIIFLYVRPGDFFDCKKAAGAALGSASFGILLLLIAGWVWYANRAAKKFWWRNAATTQEIYKATWLLTFLSLLCTLIASGIILNNIFKNSSQCSNVVLQGLMVWPAYGVALISCFLAVFPPPPEFGLIAQA